MPIEWKFESILNEDAGSFTQILTDPHHHVTRWIVDTRENHIRENLIKLGWTPPTEKE